jgi:hypothetical protein
MVDVLTASDASFGDRRKNPLGERQTGRSEAYLGAE